LYTGPENELKKFASHQRKRPGNLHQKFPRLGKLKAYNLPGNADKDYMTRAIVRLLPYQKSHR
jgi:hypothetical protein